MNLSWAQNSLDAYADDQRRTYVHSSNTDQVALNERLNNKLTVAVDWFSENGLMAYIQRSF